MDKEKIYNILMSDNIVQSINNNLDYLFNIIPELKYMVGFEHKHPHHHLDVWNHTLCALSLSVKDFEVRMSLLLHDIGKPFSFVEGEVRHFPNHPYVSMQMAYVILKRLEFNDEEICKLCYLINMHDTPIKDEEISYNEDLMKKRFLVQVCDAFAHNPNKLAKRKAYLQSTYEKFKNQNNEILELINGF